MVVEVMQDEALYVAMLLCQDQRFFLAKVVTVVAEITVRGFF